MPRKEEAEGEGENEQEVDGRGGGAHAADRGDEGDEADLEGEEQLAPDDAGMMGDLGDPTAGRVRGCYYANNGADARLTNEDPSKLSVVVTMLKRAQGLAGIGLEKGEEGAEGEADIEEPVSSRPNCTGKAYLSVDGSPGRLAYREQARLLSVGDHSLANVSVHCGSLHVENKVWGSIGILLRSAFLEDVFEGIRDTSPQLSWVLSPSDPNEARDECRRCPPPLATSTALSHSGDPNICTC